MKLSVFDSIDEFKSIVAFCSDTNFSVLQTTHDDGSYPEYYIGIAYSNQDEQVARRYTNHFTSLESLDQWCVDNLSSLELVKNYVQSSSSRSLPPAESMPWYKSWAFVDFKETDMQNVTYTELTDVGVICVARNIEIENSNIYGSQILVGVKLPYKPENYFPDKPNQSSDDFYQFYIGYHKGNKSWALFTEHGQQKATECIYGNIHELMARFELKIGRKVSFDTKIVEYGVGVYTSHSKIFSKNNPFHLKQDAIYSIMGQMGKRREFKVGKKNNETVIALKDEDGSFSDFEFDPKLYLTINMWKSLQEVAPEQENSPTI